VTDVVPEIIEAFPAEFEACWSLHDFAQAHRPQTGAASLADADGIVVRTYIRSTKTYGAAVRLAQRGYGVQAGMLARSLFEDMLVAHWVRRHPTDAPATMGLHHQHNLELFREGLSKYGRAHELAHVPGLTDEKREELVSEFGRRHWTGLTLLKIAEEIQGDWVNEQLERRMLWQVFDITQLMNNLLVHHSGFALDRVADSSEPGVTRFDVGPSKVYIHEALLSAWFSYGNTCSLVHDGGDLDDLNVLFTKHLPTFAQIRSADTGEDAPRQ